MLIEHTYSKEKACILSSITPGYQTLGRKVRVIQHKSFALLRAQQPFSRRESVPGSVASRELQVLTPKLNTSP